MLKQIVIGMSLFIGACQTTPISKGEYFCEHVIKCFPKGNYGACVVGIVNTYQPMSDSESKADWRETKAVADMDCNSMELALYKQGFDMHALK